MCLTRSDKAALCLSLLFLGFPTVGAELDLPTAAGQLFIFGVPYHKAAQGKIGPESIKHFQGLNAGSFILFRRDLVSSSQVKALTDSLHSIAESSAGAPALVSVDQEGGNVTRVPFNPPLPSARALGLGRNAAISSLIGRETAFFLRQLGINGNLAPVLDLGSESPSFIGSRSFSSQAPVVSDMGNAFAQGLIDGKVLPVGKHFPGIGPVAHDPHVTMVLRSTAATDLLSKDLLPFRKFSSLYPSGLMVSHLIYPALDPLGTPGTFSKEIHQKYARDLVGYQGLLMTDDLLMIKTKNMREFQENVQKTFLAGADLIMISWSLDKQKAAIEALLDGVRKGKIDRADIIARAKRVIQVRKDLGRPVFSAPQSKEKIVLHPSPDYTKAIDRLVSQIFTNGLVNTPPEPPEKISVFANRLPLAKSLSEAMPTVKIQRGRSLKQCNQQNLCLYVLRSRRDLPQFEAMISVLKNEVLEHLIVIELFDDPNPSKYRKIVMPVRAGNWHLHLAQQFKNRWREKLEGRLAQNGPDISNKEPGAGRSPAPY